MWLNWIGSAIFICMQYPFQEVALVVPVGDIDLIQEYPPVAGDT